MISNLRQITLFCLFIASITNFAIKEASAETTQTISDEEAFLIRRIAEFWKDGDYRIVKSQILDFFDKYPNSKSKDYFSGILGDIYLHEKSYQKALDNYEAINNPEITEKIIINKLQCYYELDQFYHLVLEGKPFIEKDLESINSRREELYFLIAEGCFRQALQESDPHIKDNLALEAKAYYEKLHKTAYADASAFALAEIYEILGDLEKSTEIYIRLAQEHPEMNEDLLFRVGVLQAKFNQEAAFETFKRVKNLNGDKANDAAFNLMVLLFQSENFDQVITSYEKIAPSIPESYLPVFDFIVGKSHFSTGDYASAIHPLSRYIDSQYIPNDQLKNALLIQMTCAHRLGDETLFNETFEKLDTLFPNDSEIPKALFIQAMIFKDRGELSLADEKIMEIKKRYPNFFSQESFLFEYGFLAYQNKRFEESYEAFKSFITDYPDSSRIDAAHKLFLSSSINYYKSSRENKESPYGKAEFFKDLKLALEYRDFLSPEELKDYSLLYAKTAYELEEHLSALRILLDHIFSEITEEDDPLALAEAHFIAGLCHIKMESDYSASCMHLEQALLLNPEMYDTSSTHLQLYNAYLSLAGLGEAKEASVEKEREQDFIHHAAEHLQEAIDLGEQKIKKENRLFLANHYFEIVKTHIDAHWTHKASDHPEILTALDRSIKHYTSLLYEGGDPIKLNADNFHLENEFLKLAKLLKYRGQSQKKLTLLTYLIQQQSQNTGLNWNSQNQALFELAITYRDLGDLGKAYETFSFIHSLSKDFPIDISNVAALESARLHFALLNESCKTESNQEVMSILNDLKELQIRKNVDSEPTHLEAALDYANIRSETGEARERDSRYLFFLKRIQDDFTSQEDLMAQDYRINLSQDLHKKQMFDAYMKFIDAEKYRIKAKTLYDQECFTEMEEVYESALSLYNEIKSDPTTPQNLYQRIVSSIEKINALNAY